MIQSICKSVRWVLSWACCYIGEFCSYMMFKSKFLCKVFFAPYQKFMMWSRDLQGVYGFKNWPWRESDLWEKVDE